MVNQLITDILVVGGGTGGTSAAIQSARRGAKTILVSEFPWLGGMLTSAGVAAPDGNELAPWQTGLWGAYLQALRQRESEGLAHSWVSLFTYNPPTGAKIFQDWVQQLSNLHWISGQIPLEVLRDRERIRAVRFPDYLIEAKIIIDGTELGDLLALGEIPHRWGWELQREFDEPSAPLEDNKLTQRYSIQSPTWVFLLQDYQNSPAPPLPRSPLSPSPFRGAWDNYGGQKFLNYGRLPGGKFMINWPIQGNDYGYKVERLIQSEASRQEFLQEAYYHSYNFAHFIQTELGQRYGLAANIFPHSLGNGAFALHPYYRESRRLRGQITITEGDILPVAGGCVAPLPMTPQGEVNAIAVGNYGNDHHYPGVKFTLQPKSIPWGGRWTGTPFTIPYSALFTPELEGFLVCEKNISVSHIANGSTRLQPVVMNLGQAAGMAAALCIELNCQPGELPIRKLQNALLTDPDAPSGVIPLFNLPPEHPEWLQWQYYYLDYPDEYPVDGNCPCENIVFEANNCQEYQGFFDRVNPQQYRFTLKHTGGTMPKKWALITTRPEVNQQLENLANGQLISVLGNCNFSGGWLVVEKIF